MSNAFNLIDGLDGLAAGIGLFSTTTLFIAATINQRWEVTLLSRRTGWRADRLPSLQLLSRRTSSSATPGSLFIGFALAAFAIRGSMKSSAAVAVAAPLLALAVPIVDASIAVIRRIIAGKNPFEADSNHIHHRLLQRGLRPRNVVILLYAVAAAFGALSLLTMNERGQMAGLVIIATSIITWVGVQHLGYPEFGEIHRILRKSLFHERQAIGNNVYLRALHARFAEARPRGPLGGGRGDGGPPRVPVARGASRFRLLGSGRSASVHGPLPAGFPRWQGSTRATSPGPRMSWTVPLPAGRGKSGQIVLTKRFDPAPLTFDNGCLLDLLERSLAPSLVRVLSVRARACALLPEDAGTAQSPRPLTPSDVTVAIPTYRREQVLVATVDSVLASSQEKSSWSTRLPLTNRTVEALEQLAQDQRDPLDSPSPALDHPRDEHGLEEASKPASSLSRRRHHSGPEPNRSPRAILSG